MRVDGRGRRLWMISSFLKRVCHDFTWRDQSVWFGCAELKLEATVITGKFLLNLVLHRYCFHAQTILKLLGVRSSVPIQECSKTPASKEEQRCGYSREPGKARHGFRSMHLSVCQSQSSVDHRFSRLPSTKPIINHNNGGHNRFQPTSSSIQHSHPSSASQSPSSSPSKTSTPSAKQTTTSTTPPSLASHPLNRTRSAICPRSPACRAREVAFFGRSNGLLYCGGCFKLRHRKYFVRFMSEGRPRARLGFNGFWKCLDYQRDAFGGS